MDQRFRAAAKFLKPRRLSQSRFIRDEVTELEFMVAQDRTWNVLPQSAKDKASVAAAALALRKLRTAMKAVPVEMQGEWGDALW